MAISSLFVLIMAAAMTQPTSATQPAAEPSCSGTQDQRSLLSNMLLMTGYSEACVATALDVCSSGQTKSPYASLVEEAREVVQQISAAVTKWDSQLGAAINSVESQLSTAVNSIDSQFSPFINKSESRLSAAINSIESQLSAALNSIDSQVSPFINKSESRLSAFMNTSESEVSAAENKSESETSAAENKSESLPRHCSDLQASGDHGSGPRQVYPDPTRPLHSVTVVCDHTVDGGGWTVFQQRTSDAQRQNFSRTWREYEDGFGDTNGEFWLGLRVLHQLTSTTASQLRIDLYDYDGGHRWAKYGRFNVYGPNTNYRLLVTNYSGDAGDSLRYHSGQAFTTYDADHDGWSSGNCAAGTKGGWWYGNCLRSNLNGYQYVASVIPIYREGIYWGEWRGGYYSLQRTAMMIRPA